jgi:hypothetical protein
MHHMPFFENGYWIIVGWIQSFSDIVQAMETVEDGEGCVVGTMFLGDGPCFVGDVCCFVGIELYAAD